MALRYFSSGAEGVLTLREGTKKLLPHTTRYNTEGEIECSQLYGSFVRSLVHVQSSARQHWVQNCSQLVVVSMVIP